MSIVQIIHRLNDFDPHEDEDTNVGQLYDILEGFGACEDQSDALEALFAVIERARSADIGSPGPVVHCLEQLPTCLPRLIQSVRSVPTPLNVWMVNRFLNSDVADTVRTELLQLLEAVVQNESADDLAVENARVFLEHQQRLSRD